MVTPKRKRRRKSRYHRGTYVCLKSGQACRYRSSWELLYMQHLDADPGVLTWSYEQVAIPYVSNVRTGKVRRYFPDFLVTRTDGSRILVEVKPAKRVGQLRVAKKLAAAREWCNQDPRVALDIVTEHTLRELGLLK